MAPDIKNPNASYVNLIKPTLRSYGHLFRTSFDWLPGSAYQLARAHTLNTLHSSVVDHYHCIDGI